MLFPGSGQEVGTRVMIFSSFRESVQEIAAMLNRHAPLIRVMTFMGQATAGKAVKGFTQKEQLEVDTTCLWYMQIYSVVDPKLTIWWNNF